MVTFELPVSSLMGMKFFSPGSSNFGDLQFDHWTNEKTAYPSEGALVLVTQNSMWSTRQMPTGEIQPKVLSHGPHHESATLFHCALLQAEMLRGWCAYISICIYPYRNQILKCVIILALLHKTKPFGSFVSFLFRW